MLIRICYYSDRMFFFFCWVMIGCFTTKGWVHSGLSIERTEWARKWAKCIIKFAIPLTNITPKWIHFQWSLFRVTLESDFGLVSTIKVYLNQQRQRLLTIHVNNNLKVNLYYTVCTSPNSPIINHASIIYVSLLKWSNKNYILIVSLLIQSELIGTRQLQAKKAKMEREGWKKSYLWGLPKGINHCLQRQNKHILIVLLGLRSPCRWIFWLGIPRLIEIRMRIQYQS